MTSSRISHHRHALAAELARRCAAMLSPQDWESVSSALGEMHDQLLEDLPDEGECDEVFGHMVANLIDWLGNLEVASRAQARIYDRSAHSNHRECAVLWMKRRPH